jgi:hypothetical protein
MRLYTGQRGHVSECSRNQRRNRRGLDGMYEAAAGTVM